MPPLDTVSHVSGDAHPKLPEINAYPVCQGTVVCRCRWDLISEICEPPPGELFAHYCSIESSTTVDGHAQIYLPAHLQVSAAGCMHLGILHPAVRYHYAQHMGSQSL